MRFLWLTLTLLGVFQETGPAANGVAVAVIYDIDGEGVVTRGPDGTARAAELYDWLHEGDVVRVVDDGRIAIALLTGSRYELSGPASVEMGKDGIRRIGGKIEPLPAIPPLPARAAYGRETFAKTKLGGVVVRGAGPGWVYPREGATTLVNETTLRFHMLPDASVRYRIVLEDDRGAVLLQEAVSRPELRLEPGLLQEGRKYYWRVIAASDTGNGVSEGAFTTLDAKSSRERESLRHQLASMDDARILGLVAEADRRVGLFWEAAETLERACRMRPGDRALGRRCEALEALVGAPRER